MAIRLVHLQIQRCLIAKIMAWIICLLFFVLADQAVLWASENILCSEEFCEKYVEKNNCVTTNTACHVQNSSLHGELFPASGPCSCCTVCLQHLTKGEFCTMGSPDMVPPMLACGPHLTCTDKNGIKTCQEMDTPCLREQKKFDKKHADGVIAPHEYRPVCDGNGNYGPIKCNGFTCFCVDEKGNRIFGEAKHTSITELTMKCECSRLHNKIFLKSSKFLDIFPVSRCLEDGSFDPLQCMDTNCYCVERETGFLSGRIYNTSGIQYSTIPCFNSSIHRSYSYLHDCEQIQWQLLDELQQSAEDGFTPLDIDIPKCQLDGWFLPVRVNDAQKYCVDKYNRPIGKYFGDKQSRMTCNCARTEYILKWNKIKDLPKCTENGEFEKVQCKGKKCFCVDDNGQTTGKEVSSENFKSLQC